MLRNTALILASSALALSACSKKAPQELPPAPGAEPVQVDPNAGQQNGSIGNTPVPGSHADFVSSVSSDRIFFDTDRYDIDTRDQMVLQSQAQWLARYPQKQIVVEGHADERGTRDYNLALGERRANAAKNFLASLGVAANRIRVVSYGKERPESLGSDDSAWAQNRRAVTVTID